MLATGVVSTQPPRLPGPASTRQDEVGDEYEIPQSIREQFDAWPQPLRDVPDETILTVKSVRPRRVTYGSGWDDWLKLCWTENGKEKSYEMPGARFHAPTINGVPHDISQHRITFPELDEESDDDPFGTEGCFNTAGCGCGGCCKCPGARGGCRCGCECENCRQHKVVVDQSMRTAINPKLDELDTPVVHPSQVKGSAWGYFEGNDDPEYQKNIVFFSQPLKCSYCRSKWSNIVFAPCGHCCCCENCAQLVEVGKSLCYWCGKRVTQKYHVNQAKRMMQLESSDPKHSRTFRRRTIQYAACMGQANPYTVATDSVYDTVNKHIHALLNGDNVPALWAEIPDGPQKWKLELISEELTIMSSSWIVAWANSRKISLKGLDEKTEDWWNRLGHPSQVELWEHARDQVQLTTNWSATNFFRHKQWNLPPSEWLGATKHEHVHDLQEPPEWWKPPDVEKEKRDYEKTQAALKKINSENFDYDAPWQPPEHYKRLGFA
jgi:hypothetical protein